MRCFNLKNIFLIIFDIKFITLPVLQEFNAFVRDLHFLFNVK